MKTLTTLIAAALLVAASATATDAGFSAEARTKQCQAMREATLEYRVWLTAGAEYVDVKNPRIESGQLVYQRFGGEVRRDAAEVLKIEPLPPDTADQAFFDVLRATRLVEQRPSQWSKVFEAVDRWFCAVFRPAP